MAGNLDKGKMRKPEEIALLLTPHMVKKQPDPAQDGSSTFNFMSQHRSLRAASTSGARRNVLKRFERVEILKKRGQWKTGDRVTGLRKTKAEV
jgi:small basic protein (TIGR04137 family)